MVTSRSGFLPSVNGGVSARGPGMSAPTADFRLGDAIVVDTPDGPVQGVWVRRSPVLGRCEVKLPDGGGFLVLNHVELYQVHPVGEEKVA